MNKHRKSKDAARGSITRPDRPRPCPLCKKASCQKYHPFCSARCADTDLNRWLTGAYVIPGEPAGNSLVEPEE